MIPKAYEKHTIVGFALIVHLLPLTLFYTGVNRRDWIALGILYLINTLALCGGMHRYFSHRGFKTSRAFQFVLALLGAIFFADVIGFSGRHRLHHKYSDTDEDVHSPKRGWWQCWFGHLLDDDGRPETEILKATPDLARYPELMWFHKWSAIPGIGLGALLYWIGGYTMLASAWALIILLTLHGPAALNYLGHQNRNRPFNLPDLSSNSILLAFVLFGEGWHNNHHYFPASARAGFRWYQFDGTYYMLKMLSWTGLIWDLREPPPEAKRAIPRGETCALP